MYIHHFGLREKPFQIAPSPRFLYPSETHDESRARILYGIEDSRGFVVVYGRVGLGKTTVLLSALEELDAHVRTALIYQPVSSFTDLLRMTAHEFGLPSEGRDEVNLIWDLNEFFIERLAAGDKCVLVVDEAQNLSLEILEKLRTLSNLQTEEASLLQIVLVGQPELHDKLMDERLLQLRQRVGVWHEIESLDEEDTIDYIFHRLAKAGARRPKDIFSPALCRRVHEWTQGVPRVINQVCDTALMIAYGRGQDSVDERDVDEAAAELHLIEEASTRVEEPVTIGVDRAASGFGHLGWARIGLGLVLGAALAGMVWITLGGSLRSRWSRGQGTTSQSALPMVMGISEVAHAASDRPIEAEDSKRRVSVPAESKKQAETSRSPQTHPATAAAPQLSNREAEEMAESARRIEGWLQKGVTVYTVHLYSFRRPERAIEFARKMAGDPQWGQPMFIETTSTQPVWYRVFAGGFQSAGRARAWIDRIKSTRGIRYARLTHLEKDAQILLPRADQTTLARSGVQG